MGFSENTVSCSKSVVSPSQKDNPPVIGFCGSKSEVRAALMLFLILALLEGMHSAKATPLNADNFDDGFPH